MAMSVATCRDREAVSAFADPGSLSEARSCCGPLCVPKMPDPAVTRRERSVLSYGHPSQPMAFGASRGIVAQLFSSAGTVLLTKVFRAHV